VFCSKLRQKCVLTQRLFEFAVFCSMLRQKCVLTQEQVCRPPEPLDDVKTSHRFQVNRLKICPMFTPYMADTSMLYYRAETHLLYELRRSTTSCRARSRHR
jgi:hypothetical protein